MDELRNLEEIERLCQLARQQLVPDVQPPPQQQHDDDDAMEETPPKQQKLDDWVYSAAHPNHFSCCPNCRVVSSHNVVCALCLEKPCCKCCRRYLEARLFTNLQNRICRTCDSSKNPTFRRAIDDIVTDVQLATHPNDISYENFLLRNRSEILRQIQNQVRSYVSIRVVVRTSANFTRDDEEGNTQNVRGDFTTFPQMVATGHEYDFDQLLAELNDYVEAFTERGSNFVFDVVTEFRLVITQFSPLAGSTYVPTPTSIVKKQAIVNVKNNDNECFKWAVISCLYPPKSNPCHVSSYTKHKDALNFDGLSFSIHVKDIPKFEKLNPDIAINVISHDEDQKGFCVIYVSLGRDRLHAVSLLLIDDPDSQTQHYTWIKNFSRLLGTITKHNGKSHVCNNCLNVFSSKEVFDKHVPQCMCHDAQQTQYPDPTKSDECKLKFHAHDKEHPFDFFFCCRFRSFSRTCGR